MAVMPIPNDWNGEIWKCWAVEWPDSVQWNAILRGFVTTPTRGRFWDGRTGSITDAQEIGNEIWLRNSPMEESLMSCNEDTLAALTAIADKIQLLVDKPCCPTGSPGSGVFNSGSRGAGITPQQPIDYTEPPGELDPPPGFDTWEEYRLHKCNAANDIVLNLKTDLLSLSNVIPGEDSFTAILAGLVGVLLTPIPYDDLAYIVGLLTVAAFEYSLLAELSTEIQSNAESLICDLYTSPNATDAQSILRSDVQALIPDVTSVELAQEWMANIVDGLTPMDAFNRLFENVATQTQDGDCSACVPTLDYSCFQGTISHNADGYVEIQGGDVGGGLYLAAWGFNGVQNMTWTLVSGDVTGWGATWDAAVVTADDDGGGCGAGSGYPWTIEATDHFVGTSTAGNSTTQWMSSGPFTVRGTTS